MPAFLEALRKVKPTVQILYCVPEEMMRVVNMASESGIFRMKVIRSVWTMLGPVLLMLGLLVFIQLPGGQTYEVIFPLKLHSVYKRETQSIYPDVLQYEIPLGGNPRIVHIEKTDGLFAENYTESHYLEDGSLVTSSPEHQDHCYYQGHVKYENNSMVTLSTCNGLSGLIQTQERRFYIEPLRLTDTEEHAVYEQVEEPIKTCGVSDDPPPKKPPSIASARALDVEKENLWNAKKYIDLFMVADQSMYNKYNRNIQSVKQRLFEIINYVNKVYKNINIFVALIGIEIWDSADQIQVVSNVSVLLTRFSEWRIQTLLPRKPHDNAQFITHVDFIGSTVGYAGLSVMCDVYSSGINQDHTNNVAAIGATIAHEMGHNLGMPHDKTGCTCGASPCIMAPALSSQIPLVFSSCSISDMKSFIYNNYPDCLLNVPQASQLLAPPICGNKFIESGEQCDCGEPQECTSKCCDAETCRLKLGCQCDDELCCENCKIKPAGTICRPAIDECDLTDMCDGTSSACPKDSYRVNGFPCMEGEGACYQGKCPLLSSQCVALWGPGSIAGYNKCFQLNEQGNRRGYCRKEGETYFACEKENVKCGLLYCVGGEDTPKIRGVIITYSECKTIVFDGGLVATGTKCSDTNVCINAKCSNMEESYMTAGCEAKCTGHAVCDHDLQCHCEEGWVPPDCTVQIDTSNVGFPPSSVLKSLCSWWWTLLLSLFSILVSVCWN
ncbi:zinc metalloproteinase-disintegrin-like crotastatin isoform X2 [Hyla sarda]|uniref:zinc metalloproteinase-disintegrin-like crotastatin isoform X2 n=1 Tax=Hyla sarda TaxID=327740 RepID=UPI0024C3D7BA|nr:zinc metalloproteinase-disintegrin-like crotastatin isoform X2 [Hyla sarda]